MQDLLQVIPNAGGQMNRQQLSDIGQTHAEVLAELALSAADSRSNSPARQLTLPAHCLPTPASPPDMKLFLPDETTQADPAEHRARPSRIQPSVAQQQPGKQSRLSDCASHDLRKTVFIGGKCRRWWPEFNAHTAHLSPKASAWLCDGDRRLSQHDNAWSVSAEPASATHTVAHHGHCQSGNNAPDLSDLPDHLQSILGLNADTSNFHSSLSPHADLKVVTPTSKGVRPGVKNTQLRQQAVASFDDDTSEGAQPQQLDTSFKLSMDGHDSQLFAGEDFPEHALKTLKELKEVFSTLPPNLVENSLREAGYDANEASESCLKLLCIENGNVSGAWSDSGSPSDADTNSIATDSQLEAPSPMHPRGVLSEWLDASETLQELDYEAKISKLHQDFPDVDVEQLDIFLGAAQGVYDTAYAHLLQSAEESQHQEEKLQQQAEADRKLAMELANEDTAHTEGSQALQNEHDSSPQDEVEQMIAKDPNMISALVILEERFPSMDRIALANVLVVNEGRLEDATQMLADYPKSWSATASNLQQQSASASGQDASPGSSKAEPCNAAGKAVVNKAVAAPLTLYEAGRPISPPPGFSNLRIQAPKPVQAPRHKAKPDIYRDARQKFKEAQEHIVQCDREFHAARRCHDMQKQKHWSSQLAYWQNVAKEEKLRASKKIFTSKNAELINTYKLDLHALHVDEALEKIEETRRDLRKFPCTWQVEAVTGKGLHSVGNEPKLLPAVKQFLDREGIEWWPGNPGMVVFQLDPRPGS